MKHNGKKNIGIVTTWHERGAAYVSKQYAKALQSSHNVYIYARGGYYARGDSEYDRSNVHWGAISGNPINAAIDIPDLLDWVNRMRIEVLLFNEQSWWLPVIECVRNNIIVGAYVDYYTAETVPYFELYDFLLCNTKRHYEAFSWHPRAYYIPWGTDVEMFKPYNKETTDELTFFHSCGYSPIRKGTDILIEAATMLTVPFKLIIHTQKDLAVLGSKVGKSIRELRSRGRLSVITETIPAPGWYSNADVYVYPSRLDGIGLTLPEAISSGLAVITTDHPPMNEFVHNSFSRVVSTTTSYIRSDGYYWDMVEPSTKDLVECMQYMIENRNIVSTMKCAARDYALKELNWESKCDQISEIFSLLTDTNRKANIHDQVNAIVEYEKRRASKIARLYNIAPSIVGPILKLRKSFIRNGKKQA